MAESTSRGMELDVSTALLALVALAASYRDDLTTTPDDRRKTEVILSDVGLTLGQIAQVTGRKYETVKTTIRRARAGATHRAAGPETHSQREE